MAEYIEREAAKRFLVSDYAYAAADMLDKVPAADVVPVVLPEHYRVVASRHENGRFYSDLTGEEVANIMNAYASGMLKPVVHGRWVGLEYDGYADGCPVYDLWECSECGEEVSGEDVPTTHPWCHGCGARMDGE